MAFMPPPYSAMRHQNPGSYLKWRQRARHLRWKELWVGATHSDLGIPKFYGFRKSTYGGRLHDRQRAVIDRYEEPSHYRQLVNSLHAGVLRRTVRLHREWQRVNAGPHTAAQDVKRRKAAQKSRVQEQKLLRRMRVKLAGTNAIQRTDLRLVARDVERELRDIDGPSHRMVEFYLWYGLPGYKDPRIDDEIVTAWLIETLMRHV